MAESSDSIWITPTGAHHAEELVLRHALRVLPGKREVFDASWNGRNVVVKVFLHPLKARYHWQRELRGLQRLSELGFLAPTLLLWGRTKKGHWAIVTEKIEDALSGGELWNRMVTLEQKQELLRRIAVELSRQHASGVLQMDMHLGNFMVGDGVVYMLDPAQVHFQQGSLRRRAALQKLAILLSYLTLSEFQQSDSIAAAYAEGRGWPWRRRDRLLLLRYCRRAKRKGVKKRLKGALRTTSRTFRLRSDRYTGVFTRQLAQGPETLQFCETMEALLRKGDILKDGRTCFVGRLWWNGQDLVIKRYNHKGVWHSLRHTIKGSRASLNWLNAHRLRWAGISTPEPLAYVDEYRGPLLWRSYFITRFVRGTQIGVLYQDDRVQTARKQQIHRKVLGVLNEMAELGISHGDMKHTNLLCDGSDIVVIDLDAVRVHWPRWLNRCRCRRDVQRYFRDFDRGANGLMPQTEDWGSPSGGSIEHMPRQGIDRVSQD